MQSRTRDPVGLVCSVVGVPCRKAGHNSIWGSRNARRRLQVGRATWWTSVDRSVVHIVTRLDPDQPDCKQPNQPGGIAWLEGRPSAQATRSASGGSMSKLKHSTIYNQTESGMLSPRFMVLWGLLSVRAAVNRISHRMLIQSVGVKNPIRGRFLG